MQIFINFFAVVGIFNTIIISVYFIKKLYNKIKNDIIIQSYIKEQTKEIEKNN